MEKLRKKAEYQLANGRADIPGSALKKSLNRLLKEKGNGLGLSHAKKKVEEWGGQLALSSQVNQGTTISIALPFASTPSWFVSAINVSDQQVIAILDDDASIHNAWDRRLFDISKHLEIHHFYSTAEFIAWYPLQSNSIQVFSDYELLDDPLTGLDALEQVNCGENAILVTSHYETLELMERCQKRKIRLLPKNLLAHVLIQKVKDGEKRTERGVDLVLIDDNKNLRQGWRFAADHAGKNILTFASPTEFEALLPQPSFTTPIYIDSDLGCGIQGETYAKALFEKGFKEIYLVTGHPPSHFRFLPWIRAILSKTPPF